MASTTTLGEAQKVNTNIDQRANALLHEVVIAKGGDTTRGAYYTIMLTAEVSLDIEQIFAVNTLTPP